MPSTSQPDRVGTLDARSMVGTFRRFGPNGPVYEIRAVGRVTPDGDDVLLEVCVLPGEEKVEYPFKQAVRDPQAD